MDEIEDFVCRCKKLEIFISMMISNESPRVVVSVFVTLLKHVLSHEEDYEGCMEQVIEVLKKKEK